MFYRISIKNNGIYQRNATIFVYRQLHASIPNTHAQSRAKIKTNSILPEMYQLKRKSRNFCNAIRTDERTRNIRYRRARLSEHNKLIKEVNEEVLNQVSN